MRGSTINRLNGRGGKVQLARVRKQNRSWMDTPDDVYFVATEATRFDTFIHEAYVL